MQKNQRPLLKAGEFIQDVVADAGVSVKVLVEFSTRIWFVPWKLVVKYLGKCRHYSTHINMAQAS